jgi:hypothetical protein
MHKTDVVIVDYRFLYYVFHKNNGDVNLKIK